MKARHSKETTENKNHRVTVIVIVRVKVIVIVIVTVGYKLNDSLAREIQQMPLWEGNRPLLCSASPEVDWSPYPQKSHSHSHWSV